MHNINCGWALLIYRYRKLWSSSCRLSQASSYAPVTSLKNLVIGNGGSTYFIYTFMEGVHFYVHSISHYYVLHSITSFDAWIWTIFWIAGKLWYLNYANHPFDVSVIYILKFHYLENSTSIFCKCLGRLLHSAIYDFTIVFIS